VLRAAHVFLFDGVTAAGCSFSLLLLRRNGLLKKPLFFFMTCFSAGGATCFIGDVFPLGGSWLENDVGFEYSLWESRLEGLAGLCAELLSDGGPVLQNIVIPSSG
jgi:hypothetical protein